MRGVYRIIKCLETLSKIDFGSLHKSITISRNFAFIARVNNKAKPVDLSESLLDMLRYGPFERGKVLFESELLNGIVRERRPRLIKNVRDGVVVYRCDSLPSLNLSLPLQTRLNDEVVRLTRHQHRTCRNLWLRSYIARRLPQRLQLYHSRSPSIQEPCRLLTGVNYGKWFEAIKTLGQTGLAVLCTIKHIWVPFNNIWFEVFQTFRLLLQRLAERLKLWYVNHTKSLHIFEIMSIRRSDLHQPDLIISNIASANYTLDLMYIDTVLSLNWNALPGLAFNILAISLEQLELFANYERTINYIGLAMR